MYASPTAVGVGIGAGGLAFTGFGIAGYVVAVSLLIVAGLLFVRLGRRRAARH
jgi:hypothetical protein